MKLLFVAKDFPYPLDQGAKLRCFHLLKTIASRHEVALLCFSRSTLSQEDLNAVRSFCPEIHLFSQKRTFLKKLADLLRSVIYHKPYTVLANTDPSLTKTLQQLLESGSYDLVQMEEVYLADTLTNPNKNVRLVLDSHNNEALILERLSRNATQWYKKWWYSYEAKKMKLFEHRSIAKFDCLACVSESEHRYFSTLHPHCILSANGVEAVATRSVSSDPRKPQLLFVGSLEYPPNAQGLQFFFEECWPRLERDYPSLTCAIIAKHPPARLRRFENSRLHFHTHVADVTPYFLESAALIVPLRAGGGTRLKILESFAHHLPVVSTSVGAEGLAVEDPRHLYLADTAEEFIAAISEVLEKPQIATQRAEQAAQLVHQKYLWAHSAESFFRAYEELTQQACLPAMHTR